MELDNIQLASNETVLKIFEIQRKEREKDRKYDLIKTFIMFFQTGLILFGLFYFLNTFDIAATTETTTTTQEVSGENSKINNVDGDQFNDSSSNTNNN